MADLPDITAKKDILERLNIKARQMKIGDLVRLRSEYAEGDSAKLGPGIIIDFINHDGFEFVKVKWLRFDGPAWLRPGRELVIASEYGV